MGVVKFRLERRVGYLVWDFAQGADCVHFAGMASHCLFRAVSPPSSHLSLPWWDAALILGPLVLTTSSRLILLFRSSLPVYGAKLPCCQI